MNDIYNTLIKRCNLNLDTWSIRESDLTETLSKRVANVDIDINVSKLAVEPEISITIEGITIWKTNLPGVIDLDFLNTAYTKLHFNNHILKHDDAMNVLGEICKLQPFATQLHGK